MSSLQNLDKENAALGRPTKGKAGPAAQQTERVPLGGRLLGNGFKKTIKRTNSLLIDDADLKKKIQVQKDGRPKSPLRRRKVRTRPASTVKRQKLELPSNSDFSDIEYVPEDPEPLEYVPDHSVPISAADMRYFLTKNLVPEKKERTDASGIFDGTISFAEIPEVDMKLEFSDFEEDENVDAVVKKQPRALRGCNVKLITQEIPNLHFES